LFYPELARALNISVALPGSDMIAGPYSLSLRCFSEKRFDPFHGKNAVAARNDSIDRP
jgi:hypothetical protein